MTDKIIIEGMQIMACVGITPEERAQPQMLEISLELDHDLSGAARTERLAMTLDYAEIRLRTIGIVHERPRVLIETIAEDIAQRLIAIFRVQRIQVEVRKYVLEHTRSVAVRIIREER